MDEIIKNSVRGKRRLERIEIRGNPYNHLMNYSMNQTKESIIYFLYDMRVAKTSQLARYLNNSINYVRNILKDLYKNRLVYRDFQKINQKKYGSSEGIYFLDNQGAFFIAADNGIEKKDINWDPRDNVVSLGAVKHSLDITEIRVCMEENKELDVVEFIGERRLGRIAFESSGEEIIFNPDAKITLAKKLPEGKIAKISFFLEYDRSTESLNSFLDKIRVYEAFYRSNKISELFGKIHPAVLIISNHETRTEKLKELIEKNKSEDIKYYFETLNSEFKNAPFKFLSSK